MATLAEACGRLGVHPTAAYSDLCDFWDDLDPDFDQTPFADAAQRAAGSPVPFVVLPKRHHNEPNYQRIAALAYWLEQINAGREKPRRWFAFPVRPTDSWLDVDRKTVGRIIRHLDACGVIVLRRGKNGQVLYDPQAGYSREARYVGPAPIDDGIPY